MVTDGPITWQALMILIPVFGAGAGVWWKLYRQVEDERQSRILACAVLTAELASFKLTVAEKYATNEAIKQVEERVVDAINRLGDRLDRMFQNRNQS